jgi:outer membrane protein insertion porin family
MKRCLASPRARLDPALEGGQSLAGVTTSWLSRGGSFSVSWTPSTASGSSGETGPETGGYGYGGYPGYGYGPYPGDGYGGGFSG